MGTACAAQQPGLAIHDAHHRVVDPVDDVAVVQQRAVGQATQAILCLGVVGALRFFAEIAAGHHQRAVPVLQ